jgi:hypothetical protein
MGARIKKRVYFHIAVWSLAPHKLYSMNKFWFEIDLDP